MDQIVNVALQIIPKSTTHDVYALVDEAISIIHKSGLKYIVCPFETVIEGPYNEVMEIAKQAQDACLKAGADDLLVFIKIQRKKSGNVSIEDKIGKYLPKS